MCVCIYICIYIYIYITLSCLFLEKLSQRNSNISVIFFMSNN